MLSKTLKGVLSVAKRKRTNGCLLYIIKIMVISSFVLLMSFFGLYVLTTQVTIPSTESLASSEMTKEYDFKTTDKNEVQLAYESAQKEKRMDTAEEVVKKEKKVLVESLEDEPGVGNQLMEETVLETTYEEKSIKDSTEEQLESITISDEGTKVGTSNETVESKKSSETASTPVDIPIYNRYELTLSDYVIKEAEGVISEGNVDITALVGQYFASMSTREKLRLINMLLSKVQHIDIPYVWGIVADGITIEEATVLQGLIEQNFTEAEIDELYTYYAKSELAQLE